MTGQHAHLLGLIGHGSALGVEVLIVRLPLGLGGVALLGTCGLKSPFTVSAAMRLDNTLPIDNLQAVSSGDESGRTRRCFAQHHVLHVRSHLAIHAR